MTDKPKTKLEELIEELEKSTVSAGAFKNLIVLSNCVNSLKELNQHWQEEEKKTNKFIFDKGVEMGEYMKAKDKEIARLKAGQEELKANIESLADNFKIDIDKWVGESEQEKLDLLKEIREKLVASWGIQKESKWVISDIIETMLSKLLHEDASFV